MGRFANILQLGVKEMRSLWFDKVLLIFLIWSLSFGVYEAANSQSTELRNASVAIVDDENATLKRFYRENDHVRLEASNDAYEDIKSENCRIEGIVLGHLRRI